MKLPDLPKKNRVQTHGYNTTTAYTAQQMKDYGHECAEAMREACAVACYEHPDGLNMMGGAFVTCAQAIRALEIEE